MNSRLCLLFLIGTVSGTMPVTLSAALPTGPAQSASLPKESSDDSNPYAVITERNIFHLNPPPPPPEVEKPKLELPVIKITGIINIGSVSKVLFVAEPKDKKEDPSYYSLAQGEKSGDGKHELELLRIHPSQDAVDVLNDGVAVTLTIKDDSLGAVSAPAAAADAGGERRNRPGNGMPGRPMFPPGRGGPPGMPGIPGAGGNGFAFPTRARRNLQQ